MEYYCYLAKRNSDMAITSNHWFGKTGTLDYRFLPRKEIIPEDEKMSQQSVKTHKNPLGQETCKLRAYRVTCQIVSSQRLD